MWMVRFAPLKIKVLPDRLFVTNGGEFHGAEAIWYPYAMNALRVEAFVPLGVLEHWFPCQTHRTPTTTRA